MIWPLWQHAWAGTKPILISPSSNSCLKTDGKNVNLFIIITFAIYVCKKSQKPEACPLNNKPILEAWKPEIKIFKKKMLMLVCAGPASRIRSSYCPGIHGQEFVLVGKTRICGADWTSGAQSSKPSHLGLLLTTTRQEVWRKDLIKMASLVSLRAITAACTSLAFFAAPILRKVAAPGFGNSMAGLVDKGLGKEFDPQTVADRRAQRFGSFLHAPMLLLSVLLALQSPIGYNRTRGFDIAERNRWLCHFSCSSEAKTLRIYERHVSLHVMPVPQSRATNQIAALTWGQPGSWKEVSVKHSPWFALWAKKEMSVRTAETSLLYPEDTSRLLWMGCQTCLAWMRCGRRNPMSWFHQTKWGVVCAILYLSWMLIAIDAHTRIPFPFFSSHILKEFPQGTVTCTYSIHTHTPDQLLLIISHDSLAHFFQCWIPRIILQLDLLCWLCSYAYG